MALSGVRAFPRRIERGDDWGPPTRRLPQVSPKCNQGRRSSGNMCLVG